ncbi:hypothetical protein G9A89_014002 [Geosiphon pyriformis]|nr:hypothetical protein G9A89_014002 [Geosiphon pyriformis]
MKNVLERIISVWLLFKSKFLVTVLGLYTGTLAEVRFGQASEVNSLIAKAVNFSTFMALSGDFNKSGSERSAKNKLTNAKAYGNMDAIWVILEKIMVESADEIFLKHWFNGSLKNLGSTDVTSSAAVYFPAVNFSLGVRVQGLLSSTLAELQAVALVLECVPSSCTVALYIDSQAAIDACMSKMFSAVPDFHTPCWVKKHYIFNLIHKKDISVKWIKIKSHSGICGNVKTNTAASNTMCSWFSLPVGVQKHFLVTEGMVVFGNAQHLFKICTDLFVMLVGKSDLVAILFQMS